MRVKLFRVQNKYFTNLFLTLTLLVIIIIILLSTIFYISFENMTMEIIPSADKDSLSQISYSVNFMIDTARTLSTQIFFDTTINSLFFNDPDTKDVIAALNRLNSYSATTPYIHSIYVYNGINRNFYTNYTSILVQNKSSFFDREIPQILENITPDKRFQPIPRKLPETYFPNDDNQFSNVYTFILNDHTGSTAGSDNAVIINVSESWMRNIINSLDPGSEGDIFIVNEKGMIVNSSKNEKMFDNISTEKYFGRIQSAGKDPGSFVDYVNGRKCLITYVPSSYTDWMFVSATPYDSIMKRVNIMKLITIVCCLVILILGFTGAYFSSHKLYKPYDNIQSRLNTIEAETRNTRQQVKQEFLRKLLLVKSDSGLSVLKDEFNKYGICLNPDSCFLLVMLKVDNYTDFCKKYNNDDRSLYKFAIMNIASELSSGNFTVEAVDMGDDNVILILSLQAQSTGEVKDNLEKLTEMIKASIKKYFNLSLSVFISPVGSLNEVDALYEEVAEASHYRLFLGHGCTAFSSEIEESRQDKFIYPLEKESSMIDSLMLGKAEETKRVYAEIIKEISLSSFNEFNTGLLRLTLSLDTALEQISKNVGMPIPYGFSSFIIEFKEFELLEDITVRFQKMIDDVISGFEERKNSKYDRLAANILETINNRYMDQNLSIEYIADSVNMSRDYVNKLFKKFTSKSIHDYILEVRMNSAKELLLNSDRNINEIALKTGFINTAYFSTLFKKYHGITPNEFRQKM